MAGVAFASLSPAVASTGTTTLHASGQASFVVGPPDVRVMRVTVDGQTVQAGSMLPVGMSRLGHVVPAVPISATIAAGTPIRVETDPAGSPRLVAEDATVDAAIDGARLSGVMLGILLAVILLQIAAFAFTRDLSILLYIGVVATLGLIELLRDGAISLGPGIPPLVGVMLLDILNGVFDLAFAIVYLRLWTDARDLFWLQVLGVAPTTALALASVAVPALHPYVEPLRAFVLCFGMVVLLGVTAARARTFPPGRYLLVALCCLALNLVYRLVRDTTTLGMPLLDHWFYEVSAVCDALVFGLAVILRWRYLLHERVTLEHRLDEATHAAEHDALTGALNRRGLLRATAATTTGTLFFVDLDGFKVVNDRYGHAAGDKVLCAVVTTMREVSGPDATIARVGGDEFVIVVPGTERAESDRLAEHLVASIATVRVGERTRTPAVSASIGFAPLAGLTLDNAMRIADAHAYRAKIRTQALSTNPA